MTDLYSSLDYGQLRVEPRLCGRLRCNADWRRDRGASQRLADHELWLVWAGRGWMQSHAGPFELRPGMCVWMRPGGIYDAETDPAARHRLGITYLHFDLMQQHGRRWRRLDPRRSAGHEFQQVPDLTYMDVVTRRIVQLVHRDAGSSAACDLLRAMLVEWQTWAVQRPGSDRQQVHRQTIERIATAMRDQPGQIAPVAELAERAGYSAAHFHALFKQVVGVGPQQFAIQVKIERARQLLSESDASVGAIAEQLGYQDIYFFSRQFKQVTGVTPSAMRGGR